MDWYTHYRRKFITWTPIKMIIRKSKKIILPGFKGIPLFDVVRFLFLQFKKTGLSERAASIAFNLLVALPPAIIFLFTLVPFLPISQQFVEELFDRSFQVSAQPGLTALFGDDIHDARVPFRVIARRRVRDDFYPGYL